MEDYTKQTIKILTEASDEQKLEALADIRENGSLQVLPYVIDLLISSKNEEIRASVIGLLQDIKEQAAVNYLVNAMKDAKYASVLPSLVECCWENGLNYSADLQFFIDIVITGDFKLSFDAFTVIENMDHTYSEETRNKMVIHIKDRLLDVDHERKLLLASLIDIL